VTFIKSRLDVLTLVPSFYEILQAVQELQSGHEIANRQTNRRPSDRQIDI